MDAARLARLLERLGTEALDDLNQWLTEELQARGVTRDEYRELLSRMDILEKRTDALTDEVKTLRAEMNQRFEQMEARVNARFDRMDERLDRMDERLDRMDERLDRMNERLDRMNERLESMLKWTVGMIGTVGAVIALLITIFKFLG